MPLTFPSSPTNGQTYVVGSRTWTWNGSIWEFNNSAIGVSSVGESEIINGSITQAKLASSLSGVTVCTSSTRPTSPFNGQMIYETDTDKTLVYNGSAWYADWNVAWGVVAVASKTSDSTMNTGLADMGLSVTWTAISGRMYKTSFHSIARTSAAGNIYINAAITDGSNGVKQYMRNGASSTDLRFSINGFIFESGLSGSTTRKVRADCNTGTALFEGGGNYPMQLIVEDIGPA